MSQPRTRYRVRGFLVGLNDLKKSRVNLGGSTPRAVKMRANHLARDVRGT